MRTVITILLAGALAAGAALPSTAQSGGPRYGGTLRAGMQTDPVGLDPHLTTATATRNMMENVYDTLVMVNAQGRYVPALAESWTTSEDGLTWTFRLRAGVRFHNGRALTADDVVYSINRIRDPNTKSPRAGDFAEVDSVTASGPSTVVIRLKRPFSPLLAKLAFSTNVIVPREVVERDGDLNRNPTGTGPFRFVGYTPQQRLVLVRSGDYWERDSSGRRLPYLDRIEFVFLPDAVARATALRAGAVDWIEYVPSSEVKALRADPNVEVVGGLSANFRSLYINNTVPPFTHVKVRQALAYAIDKKEIVDAALFEVGGIVATGTAIPPGNFFAYPRSPYTRVDLDRARRLLAEAGQASGFDAELYVTSTYDFLRTPAELIQAQLAKIGIRLRITAADWSVYLPTVFQKRYTLTILGTSGQTDPDDFLYGNFHSKGGLNLVNYNDPQFDRLLEQARATSREADRKRLYDQAQARLLETVPMVFIYHSTQYEAVRRTVRGFEHWPNTSYLGLRRTWIAP
ncbi:MAG: ABC transporter substrate-binding protein [Armatimonadota bacterium]|nr:ABC transporter substrate-binding protein [Armatimonadota bacterium]MDR7452230.1 ABC transporter substrate-binding protein [Armatimonadota bacterium]MDR7466675.1 ABC transporter substrate-binding protein [Armatimonadota bacterium]MDR7492851.1 ABC transporter substrate-binding protein [Armatimonadota bacterium]MDR7498627.1 ABC transporter substrate-binding protein [Armatimonadota bacterium]